MTLTLGYYFPAHFLSPPTRLGPPCRDSGWARGGVGNSAPFVRGTNRLFRKSGGWGFGMLLDEEVEGVGLPLSLLPPGPLRPEWLGPSEEASRQRHPDCRSGDSGAICH